MSAPPEGGDDLGVIEHPAPNVEPGDVVVLTDGSLASYLWIEERELEAGGLN
jgi:hypothetical protein